MFPYLIMKTLTKYKILTFLFISTTLGSHSDNLFLQCLFPSHLTWSSKPNRRPDSQSYYLPTYRYTNPYDMKDRDKRLLRILITMRTSLLVWITSVEPKIYIKRWFSVVPRNLLFNYRTEPVSFMFYSYLIEHISFLFLHELFLTPTYLHVSSINLPQGHRFRPC